MAPVSLRDPGSDATGGNRVSALFVSTGTHIEDPVERLRHIHGETSRSKIMHKAVGAAAMTDYGQFVPVV